MTGVPLRATWSAWALVLALWATSVQAAASIDEVWSKRHALAFERVEASGESIDGPVRGFAEDADGLIWLVAGSELLRWDGRRFLAAVIDGEPGATVDPAIMQALAADASGALWAGGSSGLVRLVSPRPGDIRLVPQSIPGPTPSISQLVFDASPGEWLGAAGTVSEVIVIARRGPPLRIPIPEAGGNRLHALHIDAAHRLWAGTTLGLFQLVPADATSPAPHWRAQALDTATPRVAALDSDPDGRLWVGLAQDGVRSVDAMGRVGTLPWPADGDGTARIFALSADVRGELWVGTFGSGLLRWHHDDRTWAAYRHERGRVDSLDDDNVWALMIDRRGLVWVGHGAGAQLFDPREPPMWHVPLPRDPAAPDARQRVHAIAPADPSGTALWLGLGTGRISLLGESSAAGAEAALDRRWGAGDGQRGAVELLQPLAGDRWWLGSDWRTAVAPAGVAALQPLQPRARGANVYTSSAAAWRGDWWLAGPDGLWRVPLDDSGQPLADLASNLYVDRDGERRVATLVADEQTLWIGTWTGLQRLSAADGRPEPIDVPGLAGHFVSTMAIDRGDRLWVGTSEGGLFVAEVVRAGDPAAWTRLDLAQGLPSRRIAALLVDARGVLWASTSRGLVAIEPGRMVPRVFRREDGAAASPYLRRSAAVLPDGSLAFGGNDALTIVRGDALRRRPARADVPLVITRLATGADDPPPMAIPGAEGRSVTWRLDPVASRLDIDVVAPVYLGVSNLRYRYRLEGVDPDWQVADARGGTASYSRLPAGRYRFEAQYDLGDGDWRGAKAIGIVRAPAWHEQPLLRLATLIVAAVLLALAVRARLLMLRRRASTLEQMVRVRTSALEQANADLARANRAIEVASLTDPLTGLHNRRYLWRRIEADVALALRSRYASAGGAPQREPADLVFFLVDIDHFKRINDLHGHAVGDQVLIEMGRRLRAVFRESDHVVRWGGEEFLAVARGGAREDAPLMAERIRASVSGTPFELPEGQTLVVRCSTGFAALPLVVAERYAFSWEDTVVIADEALYEAKAAGRDAWAGFEESGEPVDVQELTSLRLRRITAMASGSLRLRRSDPLRAD